MAGNRERVVAAALIMAILAPAASAAPAAIPEHISRTGYLVDQAWQIYRRLPATWRSCARICEPIDYRAADHENTAFAFQQARLRPGLSSETRARLQRQEILFFGMRNETVNAFRDCLDATHVAPPRAMSRADPIPGSCETYNAQTVWERWCKSFDDFANATLLPIFRKAYDTSATNHLPAGTELSIQVLTRVYADGKSTPGSWTAYGIPSAIADQIRSKLKAYKFAPYPAQIANPPLWQDVDFRWSGRYTGQSSSPFVSYSTAKFKMNCEDFYKYDKLKE